MPGLDLWITSVPFNLICYFFSLSVSRVQTNAAATRPAKDLKRPPKEYRMQTERCLLCVRSILFKRTSRTCYVCNMIILFLGISFLFFFIWFVSFWFEFDDTRLWMTHSIHSPPLLDILLYHTIYTRYVCSCRYIEYQSRKQPRAQIFLYVITKCIQFKNGKWSRRANIFFFFFFLSFRVCCFISVCLAFSPYISSDYLVFVWLLSPFTLKP